MIHFFPMFGAHAADTEFGQALREIGVPHRIFAANVSRSYRSRAELTFVVLPRIFVFALRSAWASLVRSRPAPDVVVISSDIEALVFAGIRRLSGRRRTRIVLSPFIYTSRRQPWLERLRRAYYAGVMHCVDVAIVHSRLELTRYAALFPRAATRYEFVPYGLAVAGRLDFIAAAALPGPRPVLVSAGRSGRDYATLIAAVAGLPVETHIVCDLASIVPPLPADGSVVVLDRCYNTDLVRALAGAAAVIVPISVADISAGQMVLVQAKALHRPLIVSDTPTVRDYVTDGKDGLLVPIGDAQALRAAIQRLLSDSALQASLSANAAASYARDHDTIGFLRRIIAAIDATAPEVRNAQAS